MRLNRIRIALILLPLVACCSRNPQKQTSSTSDLNDAQSKYDLGRKYLSGNGVPRDTVEGMKLIEEAAEQGLAEAQFGLGLMYMGGVVSKNESLAVKWLQKAADQGDAKRQWLLGALYQGGMGISEDRGESAKWFRRAAEQGYASAQEELGVCYTIGRGVPKDYVAGYMWLNLAAARGDAGAAMLRDLAERSMTADQITRAQSMSSNWKPTEPEVRK